MLDTGACLFTLFPFVGLLASLNIVGRAMRYLVGAGCTRVFLFPRPPAS